MRRVYVGAGSNLEPKAHLQLAADALDEQFDALQCSPVVESPARGGGANYWNAVFAFDSSLAPLALRQHLRDIEAAAGRRRGQSDCSLDLDLLMVGQITCETSGLTLPRPDILRDAFVLYPLSLLSPELAHPIVGKSMRALWEQRVACSLEEVVRQKWTPVISS